MAKPRPKAKPEKPGNTAPVPKRVARDADPALDAFTKALDAFHKKDWAKAAEQFEAVVAQSDLLELTARARQYLAASRQRLDAADTAGGAKAKGKAKPEEGDPFLRAVFEKNRGESAAALELCRQEGRDKKDERFAYLAAAIHASEGRTEEAVEALSRAIELNPKNRVHAFHDPDFADLRRDHRQLFGLS